jgi:hypothetical protein
MEHRWGTRSKLDIPAQVQRGSQGLLFGILRDASVSGAFFSTAAQMPLLASVHVQLGAQSQTPWVEAYVIRRAADGFGLEWAHLAPTLIVRVLASRSEVPISLSLPVEHSHPELGVTFTADSATSKVLLEEIKVLLAQLD